MTGVISIGRGTKGKDLSLPRWEAFIRATCRAVRDADGEIVFRGRGLGTYTDVIGQKILEESFTVVFAEPLFPSSADLRPGLRSDLRVLARKYGQEAIALTFGPVEFLAPD